MVKAVGLGGLWIVTGVNCLGSKAGPRIANLFLVTKMGILLSIIGVGLGCLAIGKADAAGQESFEWWVSQPLSEDDGEVEVQSPIFWAGEFLVAIFGALWCYGGWEMVSLTSSPQVAR